MFGSEMHFVEVEVEEMGFWMAGIGNADAVLGHLQGIWKGLLILEVLMLILFWEFASSLLETVLFLMDFREPLIKGFPAFIRL